MPKYDKLVSFNKGRHCKVSKHDGEKQCIEKRTIRLFQNLFSGALLKIWQKFKIIGGYCFQSVHWHNC